MASKKKVRVLEFVHQSSLGEAQIYVDLRPWSRIKRAIGHLIAKPEWMCYGQAYSTWTDTLEWTEEDLPSPEPIDLRKFN